MPKPNFLVAGFSRCATTYLYHLLKQHPEVHIPKEKEINYIHKYPFLLSHPNLINPQFFFPKSLYYKKFNPLKKINIDFSVMTAYDLKSAERIKRELGDIKIIFITRNKEDHKKSVIKTIQNHGEKIPKNVEMFSNFEEYIRPYKSEFKSILTITKEELERSPKKTLNKLWKFLDLKPIKINLDAYKNSSKTYFEDKFNSKLSYFLFRTKRNVLKGISYALTFIDKI